MYPGAVPDRPGRADRSAYGFHAGGDDYLTKPFPSPSFSSASLPCCGARPSDRARTAPAFASTRRPTRSDGPLPPLTPTEFRLFAALAARPGEVVRREVVAAGWPDGAIVHDNTLDTYVGRLRRKLRRLGAASGSDHAWRRVPLR